MATTGKRSRLTTDQRRAQLLEVGADVFGESPYEDATMEVVAHRAGVSPALMYHYFGTKREFAAAVIEAQSARFLKATEPDETLPPRLQLFGAIDAYLQFVESHKHGYLTLHSPAMMADEKILRMRRDGEALQQRRITTALGYDDDVPPEVVVMIHGWLAFTIAVCLRWLDEPTLTREQMRDLCVRALVADLSAAGIAAI